MMAARHGETTVSLGARMELLEQELAVIVNASLKSKSLPPVERVGEDEVLVFPRPDVSRVAAESASPERSPEKQVGDILGTARESAFESAAAVERKLRQDLAHLREQ